MWHAFLSIAGLAGTGLQREEKMETRDKKRGSLLKGFVMGLTVVVVSQTAVLADGAYDDVFVYGGIMTESTNYRVTDVHIQANGKTLVALDLDDPVRNTPNSKDTLWAERLNPDGSVDRAFDFNPASRSPLAGVPTWATYAVDLQGGGPDHDPMIITFWGRSIIRWTPDGLIDETFGQGGVAVVPSSGNAVDVLEDASILVMTRDGLFRFTPDGALDTGFGIGGVLPLKNTGTGAQPCTSGPLVYQCTPPVSVGSAVEWTDFAVDDQGRIVVGGWPLRAEENEAVYIRISPDGRDVDQTYGTDGIARGPRPGSLHMAPDGTVIVLNDGKLSRIDASGTFDRGFGVDGFADAAISEWGETGMIWGTFFPQDVAFEGTAADYWIYTSAGPLRFSKDGVRDESFPESDIRYGRFDALAIQTDCKIVAGGLALPQRLTNTCLDGSVTEPADDTFLEAVGYKEKGVNHASLSWTNASQAHDVYRDGQLIATGIGTGTYIDNTGTKGSVQVTYVVCKAATADCSNTVKVDF